MRVRKGVTTPWPAGAIDRHFPDPHRPGGHLLDEPMPKRARTQSEATNRRATSRRSTSRSFRELHRARRAWHRARVSIVALAVASVLTFASSAAGAQDDLDQTVMGRALQHRLERMFADSVVRQLSSASTPAELLDEAASSPLSALEDSTLREVVEVFSRMVDEESVPTCALLLSAGSDMSSGFTTMTAEVDSTLSERWADIMEQHVWAQLRHRPIGATATESDANQALAIAIMEMPSGDRNVLLRGAAGDTLTQKSRCASVRAMLHAIKRIPREQRAAVLRYAISRSL